MYEPNKEEDKIKEVQDALYSKNPDGIFVKKRHTLQDKDVVNAPSAWSVKEEQAESNFQIPYTKIFIGAFIFFVLAMVFAFSKFFMGANVVSGNSIDILVSGPVSIAGGEKLPLDITVKNNNNIDLQVVDLHIEYPDGTKDPIDNSTDLKRFSQVLGDIAAGQSKELLNNSILYGEENSQKIIKVSIDYRIPGSNAVFTKEKDFNILISSSPVNIKVTNPSEVNANQSINFTIDINSNSTNIVKNLVLKIDYPFGFSLSSSDPKPSDSDGDVFNIGDLAPGAKRTIKISGIVQGQDGEQRAFKFTVGNPSTSDNTVIATAYASYTSTLSLIKSSVGLDMSVNSQTGDNIAINAGEKNTVELNWQNNLQEKIYDMSLQIKVSGQTLNKSSVDVTNGFYSSFNNLISFDKSNNSLLASIDPSSVGDMKFTFSTLPSSDQTVSFGNSSIKFDISILGSRAGSDGSATQETLYSGTKIMKITSNLNLLARSFKTVGPFVNSGPFPPKVDNESTYTITWTASDSFNNVAGAKVSAVLPPNVKWTGNISPTTENITYDSGSGAVVWNIGDMRSGVGLTSQPRSVSFQVAITPSITQIGNKISLLGQSTISGTDAFSGAIVGETKDEVTTDVISDPEYVENIGTVVQ